MGNFAPSHNVLYIVNFGIVQSPFFIPNAEDINSSNLLVYFKTIPGLVSNRTQLLFLKVIPTVVF